MGTMIGGEPPPLPTLQGKFELILIECLADAGAPAAATAARCLPLKPSRCRRSDRHQCP